MVESSIKEECGVFGIFNHEDAANFTYYGLYALQHRGQEASGICSSDGKLLKRYANSGLVKDVFNDTAIIDSLAGTAAIGHNRYSTTGGSGLENAQPMLIDFKAGQIACAHNGNLINAQELRTEMENAGSIFTSTNDTDVVMHLMANSRHKTLDSMILDSLSNALGAYSMLFLTKDALYAARDHYGIRPLSLGKIDGAYTVASETCAFDLLGAQEIREIQPGEMIKITRDGVRSFEIPKFKPVKTYAHCIFEHIYFSRPDSRIFGQSVDAVRREMGRQLATENPVADADFVMSVPDSATVATLGYAEEAQIPFQHGLIRNHYVGRTFIQPKQSGRNFGVRVKFNPVKSLIKGKKIIVVDDSIVRGTTMRKIVKLLRTAEPREVHLRIASPPVLHPCFYGIDMPRKDQFLANNKNVKEIESYFDVDSLAYLSIEGMLAALPEDQRCNYCKACFDGLYPVTKN
ncbi:amidophosphoribosyltransferase [Chitinivibrio alkaliphilus]|uniref:Amidophosphoribosyltransferase n=1 Tax=Chitinivibrio alkaliphilus ACht1 TaxID=1313304 RepID=U7D694_9BACT|nr:amidophosphoribosyltransferase [Chitinivibrio alkaliphilus]ERP31458.1 amidophosphoribosyltransferase [Chitinivibrio alkaliphilus ACht1]